MTELFRDPTARTAERVSAEVPSEVDVAIIGAGTGGLTAAAYLARQGKKVAVFDPHYVAGGSATQFARGKDPRFRFDIGLHYIGEVGPDEALGRMLVELGCYDQVGFVPLDPDGYDVFHFPDFTFRMPADPGAYRDRMVELFPDQARGIDKYIRYARSADVARLFNAAHDGRLGPVQNLQMLWKAWRVVLHMKHTLNQVLDACGIRDIKLRGLIASQQGDYGLPPGKVIALLHAGMVGHFQYGGWYPKGGGQALSDTLADCVEGNGGVICLRKRVESVVIDGGRAVGVDVVSHKGEKQRVKAKAVLSGADLKHTMSELVPKEHLPKGYVDKVLGYEMAGSLFLTCLGVKGSFDELRALGLGAFNTWQFDSYDFDQEYADGETRGPLPVRGAYITSGSLKDPEPGSHAPPGYATLEVMCMVHGEPSAWDVQESTIEKRKYRHGERYQELKLGVEEGLIERTEQLFPGVKERIVFQESATPVTTRRYTGAAWGVSYGIAATVPQSMLKRPSERSPIKGLYLAGASTQSHHGIYGTMCSGRVAARRIIEDLGGRMGPPPLKQLP
ncbi:MAG: NAD(P)/FAD-dependent oxidoreductase [Deltaproteobacteria bacterium]|nr:NAD(P)/FAD-dependent oxidoreductase [Deltaproteobacteria bacterium]